ncbi:MAG: T9SS type A sorting domain-containing protein, partial [Bacteroidales bacterium]|nr:T9SS type A sorting domain-containing protein [Bacteroidales bacterium]
VNNITENSAVVSWQEATATSYEVDYGPVGHGQGQGTTVTVNDATTYTITGLESETGYSVYVRALCEADAPGPWSQVQEFTTLEEHIGIDVADGMNVSIYPNPTSSTTTIALSGVNGDVAITVVDMNGRVVMSDSMSCEGDCVKTMEVSGLAQGAYFVRINGENVNMVKKLVVK